MKKCSDVMTRNPTCCLPTDRVSSVAQLMKTENVGSIPVVDSNQSKKLVGIITDRDMALQVVAFERDPKSTTVGDVMTRRSLPAMRMMISRRQWMPWQITSCGECR
jgi:CBS domain-containing protein